MTPVTISRRLFLLAGVSLPFAVAASAVAQQAIGDHGIGGSGLSVANGGEGEDQGIGGTGIVGTIQGFGSIIVNGVHIPFNMSTPVSIDGKRASTNAMQIGHIVRVLLMGGRAQRIMIVSEVQGRIDRMSRNGMAVLSQDIDTSQIDAAGFTTGGHVAVFGIRKPDGTIVARRIERRLASDGSHVRGIPQRDGARIRIGGLALETASRRLLGKQTLVRFAGKGNRQRIIRMEAEAVVPGLRRGIVNVETYGRKERGRVTLGLGILAPGNRMQLSPDGHGFVDISVRDSSRMVAPGTGADRRGGGPPRNGGGTPSGPPSSSGWGDPGSGPRGGPSGGFGGPEGPPSSPGPRGGTPGPSR